MTFTELQTKLNAYRLALSTIGYDAMTIAPKKGSAYRNQMMAFLSGEYFKTLMSEETYQLLLESEKSSNFLESESAKYYLEQINKQKNIPQDEFVAFSQLKN
ncbi:MAG TPA: carboxypeptidase M32, partial [Erysipelothrix sp.]